MPQSEPDPIFEGKIPHRERDLQLNLEDPDWPMQGCQLGSGDEPLASGADRWIRHESHLRRNIKIKRESHEESREHWEAMLRFPNAPVYGLHQRPERLRAIDGRANFHTMRVLGRKSDLSNRGLLEHDIEDVYILHNGLNETSDFDLHYQLASQFLEHSTRPAVCIIRPFPAHLTRYPFSDLFAEKPLDTFLLDSGDLFRQFVRFMLETRWLLSVLVPRPKYNVITGGKLVECDHWDRSENLADAIVREWTAMYKASPEDKRRASKDGRPDVTSKAVAGTIEALRTKLVRWDRVHDDHVPARERHEPPAVHLVGYSLGSFLAQSAFFSWPYAISTCVTLFGGGELRRLAPTAFAQPEEWQSVLHSLRYELDRAAGGPLRVKNKKVQGIDPETFEYLRRVFYEVFLQYYQGSYTTRLAEFVQRMLFVTGGQDPIVRPDNVLDAAPSEGVNLINIAGMSHFPTQPKERVQWEQRKFWLPQLGRIVTAFAKEADQRRLDVLQRSWLNHDGTALHPLSRGAYEEYKEQLDKDGEPPPAAGSSNASLSDRWFGKEIERICNFIGPGKSGWVLVSRNEVPPVFQTEEVMKRYAAGLHHSEDLAADEFLLASKRRDALFGRRDRVTLMITDIAREAAFRKKPWLFPPRSETPGVAQLSTKQRGAAQRYFVKNWEGREPAAVRVLPTGEFRPEQLGDIGPAVRNLQELDAEDSRISVRFLPDVWIGLSGELLTALGATTDSEDEGVIRQVVETAIVAWGTGLARERTAAKAEAEGKIEAEQESPERESTSEGLLAEALKEEWISIVEFSRAGLNPRYRGKRLISARRVSDVLIHWALAYKATEAEPDEKPEGV